VSKSLDLVCSIYADRERRDCFWDGDRALDDLGLKDGRMKVMASGRSTSL